MNLQSSKLIDIRSGPVHDPKVRMSSYSFDSLSSFFRVCFTLHEQIGLTEEEEKQSYRFKSHPSK
jgi:hypothetical protein